MQWGFSTIGCPELSLKEAAAFGLEAGYPLLEVRVAGKDFAEKDVLTQLASQGRCKILGSSFGLTTDVPEIREQLQNCAQLAADCGVPYVRIFGGCAFTEPEDDLKYANARKNLAFFDSLDLPVQLVLETHDFFSSAKRICGLFDRAERTLPVIWDTWHSWHTGKETLTESWKMLKKYIIDVHIKDGNASGLTLQGDGDFPTAQLLQLLRENNYTGLISCEHEKMWHPELPDLSAAFRALDRFK